MIGAKIISIVPPTAWHALAGHPVLLPYYHMVSDETVPHLRRLYRHKNVAQFEADLDYLLAFSKAISLEDLLARVNGNRPLPKRSFLLSFDDGFREMAEIVAPILKRKGVPAIFFVNSAFVDNRELCFHHKIGLLLDQLSSNSNPALTKKLAGCLKLSDENLEAVTARLRKISYAERGILDGLAETCGLSFEKFLAEQKPYLASEQIRSLLRDGFSIGAHSVDHPFYGDLSLEEQLRQTRDSIRFVQEQFGVPQKTFAFPHSDAGVPRAFFEKISTDGTITFGTAGLLPSERPTHFQRFSMEKNDGSARQILARQSARCFYQSFFRRNNAPQTAPVKQAPSAPVPSING
ncbi:MAG TPA: polysaccharide deacetylase family protein [Verrucomicrobiae bacterium]|nr:polysaccharide deacetylase family protein [Verrucomicrobiae bacterium]